MEQDDDQKKQDKRRKDGKRKSKPKERPSLAPSRPRSGRPSKTGLKAQQQYTSHVPFGQPHTSTIQSSMDTRLLAPSDYQHLFSKEKKTNPKTSGQQKKLQQQQAQSKTKPLQSSNVHLYTNADLYDRMKAPPKTPPPPEAAVSGKVSKVSCKTISQQE